MTHWVLTQHRGKENWGLGSARVQTIACNFLVWTGKGFGYVPPWHFGGISMPCLLLQEPEYGSA